MSDSADYQLYMYHGCPFCMRVQMYLADRGLTERVPLRDILAERETYLELVQGGGKQTVPCLRINDADGERWMYESRDIMMYLEENVVQAGA